MKNAFETQLKFWIPDYYLFSAPASLWQPGSFMPDRSPGIFVGAQRSNRVT
jgi:hypothetical protein